MRHGYPRFHPTPCTETTAIGVDFSSAWKDSKGPTAPVTYRLLRPHNFSRRAQSSTADQKTRAGDAGPRSL